MTGLQSAVLNNMYRILLKSIFLLAFNAFLRIGELVVKHRSHVNSVVQREDISFKFQQGSLSAVSLVLKNFKTNKSKELFQIHLKASTHQLFKINLARCFNLLGETQLLIAL